LVNVKVSLQFISVRSTQLDDVINKLTHVTAHSKMVTDFR